MSQMPEQNQPLFQRPPARRSPLQVAAAIGMYVRSLVVIVFWTVVAAAILAFGFVALKAIWFASQVVLEATGLD